MSIVARDKKKLFILCLSPFIKKPFPLFFHTLSPVFIFYFYLIPSFLFNLLYLYPVPPSPFFSLSCFGFVEVIFWVIGWVGVGVGGFVVAGRVVAEIRSLVVDVDGGG